MSWSNLSPNSATYSNLDRSDASVLDAGTPIGLLLTLTYGEKVTTGQASWAQESGNSASWSNISAN